MYGNEQQGITWMMDEEEGVPYMASLPGYNEHIVDIFKVPALDWKDKTLFRAAWLTLKGMTWDYTDDSRKDIH